MRSLLIISALLFPAAIFSGCASIINGSHQEVSFHSSPEGATITIGGQVIGTTPFTTSLKIKSGQSLVVSKDGFKPLTLQLETRINGWFWGNIVCGGVIGSTIDGMSGAVHEYSPGQYMVTLIPLNADSAENKTALDAKQKAKDFIVVGYKDILSDLSKGEGQYIDSLMDLLNVAKSDRPDAAKKIRSLSEVYSNIADFAEHVVDLYLK